MQIVMKESRSRLQGKENYQKWGRTLYKDKRAHPPRRQQF